jgi:hypothetical protein
MIKPEKIKFLGAGPYPQLSSKIALEAEITGQEA